ncbi:hypothetical protein L2E82_08849 [Cichorium intybus]|uniref:Uncharacterized protein n=1 Tax=Cichorium intybus TaxID=13427 RepID=A0ACB9G835_CICIN|nr:hypothetical protein L2E82_08849 [Cichorium intybus]
MFNGSVPKEIFNHVDLLKPKVSSSNHYQPLQEVNQVSKDVNQVNQDVTDFVSEYVNDFATWVVSQSVNETEIEKQEEGYIMKEIEGCEGMHIIPEDMLQNINEDVEQPNEEDDDEGAGDVDRGLY